MEIWGHCPLSGDTFSLRLAVTYNRNAAPFRAIDSNAYPPQPREPCAPMMNQQVATR